MSCPTAALEQQLKTTMNARTRHQRPLSGPASCMKPHPKRSEYDARRMRSKLIPLFALEFARECSITIRFEPPYRLSCPAGRGVDGDGPMKFAFLYIFLILACPALGQKPLPALRDGTVIDDRAEFRHDGALLVSGHVKLKGISLDLRGPVTVAAGAELELEDVNIKVSDPPGSPNGASGLRCEGPARIRIHRSTMTAEGSAHPIWWLQGDVAVDDFQTTNAEFHLDHVQAVLENFAIFELEISHSSHVVGRRLHLV